MNFGEKRTVWVHNSPTKRRRRRFGEKCTLTAAAAAAAAEDNDIDPTQPKFVPTRRDGP